MSEARDTQPRERLDILGVLHELRVRAQRRDPLHRVHGRTLCPPVAGLRVEPVHRVHDDRHAGRARRDAAVHARLGVVRVDDRGPQAPEHADELGQRARVVDRRERTRRVLQRHVTNAAPGQRVDVRARRRYADDVVARGRERLELRTEQELEADVGGRDVREQWTARCSGVAHVANRA